MWLEHDIEKKGEFCRTLVGLVQVKAKRSGHTALHWLKRRSPPVTDTAQTPKQACEALWEDLTTEKITFVVELYGHSIRASCNRRA